MQSPYCKIEDSIAAGNTATALHLIEEALQNGKKEEAAQLYYLKGRAYMKTCDWKEALSAFLHADELEPQGKAAEAILVVKNILNFYYRDLYNP